MNKKKTTIWSIVILVLIIGIGYQTYEKYGRFYEMWGKRWGITISKPTEIIVAFESQPSFNGDGEGYYVLKYTEKQIRKIKNQDFWQPINEASINDLNEKVLRFKESVIEIYPDEADKYERLYQLYPTEYGQGDLYFYKKKDDGSYGIVVLNVENKRMYLMEWTQ